MLVFNPDDPFPLLDLPYKASQKHSAIVDEWLGLRIEEAEAAARARLLGGEDGLDLLPEANDQQLWLNLPAQAMLTPYIEIREMLSFLQEPETKAGSHIVDLGAGYGRLGFVIANQYKDLRFTGYEFVRERVEESNRCLRKFGAAENVKMLEADLSDESFHPIEANVYFIYDFGTTQAIMKTLNDLRQISMRQRIIVVARGRASRDAIDRDCPWLSQVVQPRHYRHFSFYFSA